MREHAGSPRRLDVILRQALSHMETRTAATGPLLDRAEASRSTYERRALTVQVDCELETVERSRKAIAKAQAHLARIAGRRP